MGAAPVSTASVSLQVSTSVAVPASSSSTVPPLPACDKTAICKKDCCVSSNKGGLLAIKEDKFANVSLCNEASTTNTTIPCPKYCKGKCEGGDSGSNSFGYSVILLLVTMLIYNWAS